MKRNEYQRKMHNESDSQSDNYQKKRNERKQKNIIERTNRMNWKEMLMEEEEEDYPQVC